MTDLALKYVDGIFDLDFGDGGDTVDAGLRTAVIISLFTDGLAEDGDVLPEGESDRRGWWGDVHPRIPGDRIGSRLWLLAREKQIPAVRRRAEAYARQALQWLIDDGIATAVTVTVDSGQAAMTLEVRIQLAQGLNLDLRVPVVRAGSCEMLPAADSSASGFPYSFPMYF